MIASTKQQELRRMWTDILTEAVTTTVNATGVPVAGWRSAGKQTKARPDGETITHWIDSGFEQLEAYADWLDKTSWKFVEFNNQPLVEFEVTGHLGDNFVKGFLDSVMVTEDGTIVLVDYKTGSRTPYAAMQLGVYRVMLRNITGIDATHGSFFMTRKGEPTEPVSLHRYTDEYVVSLFRRLNAAVEGDVFIPNDGSHCYTCDVKSSCYAQGGVNAYLNDPDHPSYIKPETSGHPQEGK